MTRHIILTEAQSEQVDRLVATGRYRDAGDALAAGLELLEDEERQLAGLRERLNRGLDQVLAGEFAEGTGEEAIRGAFEEARNRR